VHGLLDGGPEHGAHARRCNGSASGLDSRSRIQHHWTIAQKGQQDPENDSESRVQVRDFVLSQPSRLLRAATAIAAGDIRYRMNLTPAKHGSLSCKL
jgi:hypothetical protein